MIGIYLRSLRELGALLVRGHLEVKLHGLLHREDEWLALRVHEHLRGHHIVRVHIGISLQLWRCLNVLMDKHMVLHLLLTISQGMLNLLDLATFLLLPQILTSILSQGFEVSCQIIHVRGLTALLDN